MNREFFIRTPNGRHQFIIDDDFCSSCGVGRDNCEPCKLFVASWLTLLSDSPLNVKGNLKPLRLYKSFLSFLKKNGLRQTVLDFSALAHVFVSQQRNSGQSTLTGDWISEFRNTPVFYEYNRYFKSEDPILAQFIYCFLTFGKKMPYIDAEFESVAFRNWMGIEERLATNSLPDAHVNALRIILRKSLPPFTITNLFPKFGPGSVSERGLRDVVDKVEAFQHIEEIRRFLYNGHIGLYGYGKERGLDFALTSPVGEEIPDRRLSSVSSRLHFVPKDLKTSRSICMEPNTLQFYQQGVMRCMMEHIDGSPFSRFIRLEDQSRNRRLSRLGSIDMLTDTIDLSSASDSLSFDLVKKVFPPSWQIPMRVTRSSSVDTPVGKIYLCKFAPMGSALCFPTQCIVFTSVLVYAASIYAYERLCPAQSFNDWLEENVINIINSFSVDRYYTSSPFHFNESSVYGDDICCDSRLTDIIMSILDSLGFTVNHGKSFMGSQAFRESCGGFYLNGYDVTPLFFRIKACRGSPPDFIASLVSLANSAFLRGYDNLYHYLVKVAVHDHRLKVMFVEPLDNNFGLYSDRPTNHRLKSRVNKNYQRFEVKTLSITYQKRHYPKYDSLDRYLYDRWMGTRTSDSSDAGEASQKFATSGARAVWRWTPAAE